MNPSLPTFFSFLDAWNRSQELATPALHERIARWFDNKIANGSRRLLLLAFRGAGKSTLLGLLAAWLLKCDPDRRILVLAAESQLATKTVRTVRRILESHPDTQALKPAKPEEWAADRLTVPRRLVSRDPSLLARGIGANITGSHADAVICDDVEVPNTCGTPAKRADLRHRLSEIDYILSPGGPADLQRHAAQLLLHLRRGRAAGGRRQTAVPRRFPTAAGAAEKELLAGAFFRRSSSRRSASASARRATPARCCSSPCSRWTAG